MVKLNHFKQKKNGNLLLSLEPDEMSCSSSTVADQTEHPPNLITVSSAQSFADQCVQSKDS